MIPRGSEPRGNTPIALVAIHTAEGATTAKALRDYLDQPSVEASYHKLVDDTEVITYLPDYLSAWAMLSGNHRSLQLCFTGFAAWPRSEWLAHDTMLRQGASEVAAWCAAYKIPTLKLTPLQVGNDWWGICGHLDWTLGKHEGTHTDPGPYFPWDVFIGYVLEAELNDEQNAVLHEIRGQLAGNQTLGDFPGWPARADTTDKAKTLVDYIRALHAEQQSQRWLLNEIVAKLNASKP